MKTRLLMIISLIAFAVFGIGSIAIGQNEAPKSGTVNFNNPKEGAVMLNVKADAIRKDGVINVTVSGDLPNSCYKAKIVDKYPGGEIKYIQDPGSAQVFIKETQKKTGPCAEALVPWKAQVKIPDSAHEEVSIFINGKTVTKTQVQSEPLKHELKLNLKINGQFYDEAADVLSISKKPVPPAATPQQLLISLLVQWPWRSIWKGQSSTTQLYDCFIKDPQGKVIWQWSRGMMFAQQVTDVTIGGGDPKEFQMTWNYSSEAIQEEGTYTIQAIFLATGQKISKTFKIKFLF